MEFLERLAFAGVVGAGGAGFPAHKKLDCTVDSLIINCAECEPILETDKFIMRTMADKAVSGIAEAARQTGANNIILAIKEKYKREIDSLKSELNRQRITARFQFMSSFYPAGDEQVMVYETLGKTVPPAGIPLNVGAVVSNICTMVWIADAVKGIPVTRKLITVAGKVRNPCIINAPVGSTVGECVELAGIIQSPGQTVILGGPMMGKYLPLENAVHMPVTKTTGGIIVVNGDSSVAGKQRLTLGQIKKRAKSACIQCSFCTEQCPRFLIGHPLRPHKLMRSLAFADGDGVPGEESAEALLCSECGVCENYACPMGLSPRRVNMYFKERLRRNGIRYTPKVGELAGKDEQAFRKIPSGRLINRLGYAAYEFHADDMAVKLETDEVSIPLKQHAGTAAVPVVKPGDTVKAGQLIGRIPENALGSSVHASIDGIVTAVDESVHISKDGTVKQHA